MAASSMNLAAMVEGSNGEVASTDGIDVRLDDRDRRKKCRSEAVEEKEEDPSLCR